MTLLKVGIKVGETGYLLCTYDQLTMIADLHTRDSIYNPVQAHVPPIGFPLLLMINHKYSYRV